MGHRFADIAFTPTVRAMQEAQGSRAGYASFDEGDAHHYSLGAPEAEFIAGRDSFYMASVSETGWPYVQHRGGPRGFLRVLDERTIGFTDFRGNRQYVTVGNLARNDRVSLILVDYGQRRRLKILGRARIADLGEEALDRLAVPDYRARVERGVVIRVEAFDWNCPQHIPLHATDADMDTVTSPLRARIAALEAELAAVRAPAG
jgi:predicted pyridoxine 5'-phosphate oxidase superfamily flavin-nucleotide-binding protein